MAKTPFLEAAEHCERFARNIRQRQVGAVGRDAFSVEEPGTGAAEEVWAHRFASHVVSPIRSEDARPPLSSFLAAPADRPKKPVLHEENRPESPILGNEGGHIGSVLGKAGPRRNLAGRLFRGRDK